MVQFSLPFVPVTVVVLGWLLLVCPFVFCLKNIFRMCSKRLLQKYKALFFSFFFLFSFEVSSACW